MLSDLQEARRLMKKTTDVIADSQMMTLGNFESLKSCQVKLSDKDNPYNYVTVTDSIQRFTGADTIPIKLKLYF